LSHSTHHGGKRAQDQQTCSKEIHAPFIELLNYNTSQCQKLLQKHSSVLNLMGALSAFTNDASFKPPYSGYNCTSDGAASWSELMVTIDP
jgi:hypothetical protein